MGMPGYTKLFSSILASTIWSEDDKTRIVWITLLAMADKTGIAECSVPGLAVLARVDVEDCRAAIAKLQSPDPDSRSVDNEGRRIAPTDGGFQILNHAKYRAKMGADERREYLRIKQAEYRKRQSTNVNNVSDKSTLLTHAEAEAEAYTEAVRTNTGRKRPFEIPALGEIQAYCKERNNNVDPQQFFNFYTSKGWMVGKNKMVDWRAAVRTWEKRGVNGKPKRKIYPAGKCPFHPHGGTTDFGDCGGCIGAD